MCEQYKIGIIDDDQSKVTQLITMIRLCCNDEEGHPIKEKYSNYELKDFNTGPYYYEYIRNLNAIIKLNTDEATKSESNVVNLGSTENQIAVCRTLRAYYYMHLTDMLGMIPYTEAVMGDEGNFNPKYDTQEFIYEDLERFFCLCRKFLIEKPYFLSRLTKIFILKLSN